MPSSRNSLCPCGSGRRYKDCHGAIGAAQSEGIAADTFRSSVVAPTRSSSYRAPGSEWARLTEADRERCGEMMERALQYQLDGRLDDAAAIYTDVLAHAPETHDALHMLGVVELNRDNLEDAERLIVAAMELRAVYPAIEHNMQLVQDAKLARACANTEELCERALPLLVDLALAPEPESARRRVARAVNDNSVGTDVHLIGPALTEDGDDAWLLRRLAQLLAPARPVVWTAGGEPRGAIAGQRSRRLDGDIGAYPRGGTHVFAGVNFELGQWAASANADRAIVFCQCAAPATYLDQLRSIACDGARQIELVFGSRAMASRFGLRQAVLPPPIDLAPYNPRAMAEPPSGVTTIDASRAWTVGVVGQNGRTVSEGKDADFLKELANRAGQLDIYDPGRLRYVLGGEPAVRFHPRRAGGLAQFLGRLRCLLYRANPWWLEGVGRELFEAMGIGVPVLCPRSSIYAEYIEDRVDGLLYASDDEATRQVVDLEASPAWAAEIGRAGRAKAEALFGQPALSRCYYEFIVGSQRGAKVAASPWVASAAGAGGRQ